MILAKIQKMSLMVPTILAPKRLKLPGNYCSMIREIVEMKSVLGVTLMHRSRLFIHLWHKAVKNDNK